jgi:hypothetical protein
MNPILTSDNKTLMTLCKIVSELAYIARCQGWKFDHIEGADEIIKLVEEKK